MSEMEHWDTRYREGNMPWDSGRPSTELVRVVREEPIRPCRAIELGCGTGTNTVWLAAEGFEVTGVDFSAHAIEAARRRAANAGVSVRFVAADVLDPPAEMGGPFDFFFDRGCYHVIRRAGPAHAERYVDVLRQMTAPGAVGLVLTGNAREPHSPGPPVVSEEELRAELGRHFTVEWLREFRFDRTPGVDIEPLAWSCLLKKL